MADDTQGVPWSRLTCTWGTAETIPSWLRVLRSPSPKLRAAALWRLDGAFVHQGTVWTAAVAAVPFLIDLLRSPDVGGKEGVLALLESMMTGWYDGYDAATGRRNIPDDAPGGEKAMPSTEQDNAGEGSQPQRVAIRASIWAYQALLGDPDTKVRIAAVGLLGRCRSGDFDPAPVLMEAHAGEADSAVRAAIVRALAHIYDDGTVRIAFLTTAMRTAATDVERTVAALELVEGARNGAPDDAVALLVRALARPSRRVDRAYRVATRGGSLAPGIGWALRQLAPARLRPMLPELIANLRVIGCERVRVVGELLVSAVFAPASIPLDADALSTEQRAVLDALFDADLFWRDGADILVSVDDYSLLDSRPRLADYLGRTLPPEDALGAVAPRQPHRPAPFTIKAYETRIRQVYGYLHLRRKKGYRFEPGPDADLYSPDAIHLFYFPRRADAVVALEREAALLLSLPRLPIIYSAPHLFSRDTRAAGRAFVGGWALSGVPLTPDALGRLRDTPRYEQFATSLARFLHELHAVPPSSVPVPLPAVNSREMWEALYTDVRAYLFDYLPRETRRRIGDGFESFMGETQYWTWTPALIHCDFTPRNVLYSTFSDGSVALSGIQGLRHAGLGDPAYDLATLLGPEGYATEFVHHFAGAYPELDEQFLRARFYAGALWLRRVLEAATGGDRQGIERAVEECLRLW